MVWRPPVEPCSAKVKDSFAFTSTAERWPTILGSVIDALYQACHALSYSKSDQSAKVQEAKQIIEALSKLKHDMGRDRPLLPIGEPKDGGVETACFDDEIARQNWTWFSAPWLFAECYLYRLLRAHFGRSTHWKTYDPFSAQKLSAFRSSGTAINQLAQTVEELVAKAEEAAKGNDGKSAAESKEGMRLIFQLLCQSSLWGNATDLSLLTSLSHADIQTLQSHGLSAESQASKASFILTGLGGVDSAWEVLSSGGGGGGEEPKHVDVVLDNAGFELVTDLLLADWLLATGLVASVTFHPKNMPWFVSDVTPADWKMTLEALQDPEFFERKSTSHPAGSRVLQMNPREVEERRAREASPHPKGSKDLVWRPDDDEKAPTEADAGERGRGRQPPPPQRAAAPPAGSHALQLDPSYFRSARSRTVSPTRSFAIDSESLSLAASALAMEKGEEEARRRRDAATPVSRLAARWAAHTEAGRFRLAFDAPLGGRPAAAAAGAAAASSDGHEEAERAGSFWTTPFAFGEMVERAEGESLIARLRKSDLVIFKGDLNYRKLTYDAQWPSTTPFRDAVGPLAGEVTLLSLRTNKADVCVGLDAGTLARVEREDPKWRTNGRWAVVEFLAKQRK